MIINLYFVKIRVELELNTLSVRHAVKLAIKKDGAIAAVHTYRQMTGSSLKEALDYVNRFCPNGKKIGQAYRSV